MNWDSTLKLTDLAIILATVAGPILAVQAQKWLEAGRAQKERQRAIFRTLMATRAERLSGPHVQALNAISIEFYGKSGKLKAIIEAWKIYFDHIKTPNVDNAVWTAKFNDLFVNLLLLMAAYLGYSFSRVEIEKEIYSPIAHGTIQSDQEIIRRGLAEMFSGKFAIPMDLKRVPGSPEVFKEQDDIRKATLNWLAGNGTVSVVLKKQDEPPKQGIPTPDR